MKTSSQQPMDQLRPCDFDRLACKKMRGAGGVARMAGMPHGQSTQRLGRQLQEAFRQTVGQLQRERSGGRVWGEAIRQFLGRQPGMAYSLNGGYHLMKRLGRTRIPARAVSPCASSVAQAEFKKASSRKSRQRCRLNSCTSGTKDEMRIGQRGTQTRLWACKETPARLYLDAAHSVGN